MATKKKPPAYTLDDLLQLAAQCDACTGGIDWLKAYKRKHPTHSAEQFFRGALDDHHPTPSWMTRRPDPRDCISWRAIRRGYLEWVATSMVKWPRSWLLGRFDGHRVSICATSDPKNVSLFCQLFGQEHLSCAFRNLTDKQLTDFLAEVFS